MSTSYLTIKDGEITNINCRYLESNDETTAKLNGWFVCIWDGTIYCRAERMYSDGPAAIEREYSLQDGLLGLSGGNINERYTFFRTEKFQKFLANYELTRFEKSDPNKQYFTYKNNGGTGWYKNYSIYRTDGKIEVDYEKNTSIVSHARYVILQSEVDYQDKHSFERRIISLLPVERLEELL